MIIDKHGIFFLGLMQSALFFMISLFPFGERMLMGFKMSGRFGQKASKTHHFIVRFIELLLFFIKQMSDFRKFIFKGMIGRL